MAIRHTAIDQSSGQGGPADEANGRAWERSIVTEPPLSQFKQAWALAKDDPRVRSQMVHWLNEQIQSDDMGLP